MATMIYLLPHWEVKGKAPVWSVWIDLVRCSMWKNASWVFWWLGYDRMASLCPRSWSQLSCFPWFFPMLCALLIGWIGIGLLSALLLSCLSWGSSGWWVLLSVLAMLHSFRCGWHQWRFFWWEFCWCMLPKKSFAWAWEIKDDFDHLGDYMLFIGTVGV